MPLLEAFHFGVPVVARPAGAMPEVGGDAVLWADGDPAMAGSWWPWCSRTPSCARSWSLRGRERLEEFSRRADRARRCWPRWRRRSRERGLRPRQPAGPPHAASTMELQYEHMFRREAELLGRRLGMDGGDVLSVGCGWHPGRHAFPAPAWRMTGVDVEEERPRYLRRAGHDRRGPGRPGGRAAVRARELRRRALSPGAAPHRLRGLARARVRRGRAAAAPGRRAGGGGAGLAAPGGRGAGAANALGLGQRGARHAGRHPALARASWSGEARAAGLEPELHAVTYSWRRLPPARAARAVAARPGARVAAARGARWATRCC